MEFEKDKFNAVDKLMHMTLHQWITLFAILIGVKLIGFPFVGMIFISFLISNLIGIGIELIQQSGKAEHIELIGEAPVSWRDLVANEVGWLSSTFLSYLILL